MALEEVSILCKATYSYQSNILPNHLLQCQVVKAAQGQVPVFLDGGVRRGTDVFKALALGASGIFVSKINLQNLSNIYKPSSSGAHQLNMQLMLRIKSFSSLYQRMH